jgi:hypothetical protein
MISVTRCCFVFIVTALVIFRPAVADDDAPLAPWVFEMKGGIIEPDLPLYEEFYGSDDDIYFGLALAYQFRKWMELGGEIGYMKDNGVGVQPGNSTVGGKVKYTLIPAHLYVNFLGVFSADPLFVPYIGGGITSAYYNQDIESQSGRSGRTDIGFNARAGVRLALNRFDQHTAARAARDGLINSYLYLEGQYFTTEVDGIDLGGITYLLGLRLEFDFGD